MPDLPSIFGGVMTSQPAFPSSHIVKRWQELPAPKPDGTFDKRQIRAGCEAVHQVMLDWQSRFGRNPDAKEEAPLLAADMFQISREQAFEMNLNWPRDTQPEAVYLQIRVQLANRDGNANAIVLWRDPQVRFRSHDGTLTPFRPLREFLSEKNARQLGFGNHPKIKLGENDFLTNQPLSPVIRIPLPPDARIGVFQVQAELDVEHGEDCIVRCTIAQREDTDQGKSVSGLLANPKHPDYPKWKTGVMQFAQLLPQLSHREPAPSDRDPIPAPFDNSYNNAERNAFHYQIKYHRDDAFLIEKILDDNTRRELDIAWTDLYGSFDYHNSYLVMVAKKFDVDLQGKTIETLRETDLTDWPEIPRQYARDFMRHFQQIQKAFIKAQPGHLEDVRKFASRAWRRPLVEQERQQLRAYYRKLITQSGLDHPTAIRAVLTRILMAPEFLYRVEKPPTTQNIVPLSQWELARPVELLFCGHRCRMRNSAVRRLPGS